MRDLIDLLFGGNKAVRDYAFATIGLGLVAFIAVGAMIHAVEWAERRETRELQAIVTGKDRTYTVTRSILDDDITTGSLRSSAADTRLDPCKIDQPRLNVTR